MEMKTFRPRHEEYDIIKHFASYCQHFTLLSLKTGENMHSY